MSKDNNAEYVSLYLRTLCISLMITLCMWLFDSFSSIFFYWSCLEIMLIWGTFYLLYCDFSEKEVREQNIFEWLREDEAVYLIKEKYRTVNYSSFAHLVPVGILLLSMFFFEDVEGILFTCISVLSLVGWSYFWVNSDREIISLFGGIAYVSFAVLYFLFIEEVSFEILIKAYICLLFLCMLLRLVVLTFFGVRHINITWNTHRLQSGKKYKSITLHLYSLLCIPVLVLPIVLTNYIYVNTDLKYPFQTQHAFAIEHHLEPTQCEKNAQFERCKDFVSLRESLEKVGYKQKFSLLEYNNMRALLEEHNKYEPMIEDHKKDFLSLQNSELFTHPATEEKYTFLHSLWETTQKNNSQLEKRIASFSKKGVDITVQYPYTDLLVQQIQVFSSWVDLYEQIGERHSIFLQNDEGQAEKLYISYELDKSSGSYTVETTIEGEMPFRSKLLKSALQERLIEECAYLRSKFLNKGVQPKKDFMTLCPSKILIGDNVGTVDNNRQKALEILLDVIDDSEGSYTHLPISKQIQQYTAKKVWSKTAGKINLEIQKQGREMLNEDETTTPVGNDIIYFLLEMGQMETALRLLDSFYIPDDRRGATRLIAERSNNIKKLELLLTKSIPIQEEHLHYIDTYLVQSHIYSRFAALQSYSRIPKSFSKFLYSESEYIEKKDIFNLYLVQPFGALGYQYYQKKNQATSQKYFDKGEYLLEEWIWKEKGPLQGSGVAYNFLEKSAISNFGKYLYLSNQVEKGSKYVHDVYRDDDSSYLKFYLIRNAIEATDLEWAEQKLTSTWTGNFAEHFRLQSMMLLVQKYVDQIQNCKDECTKKETALREKIKKLDPNYTSVLQALVIRKLQKKEEGSDIFGKEIDFNNKEIELQFLLQKLLWSYENKDKGVFHEVLTQLNTLSGLERKKLAFSLLYVVQFWKEVLNEPIVNTTKIQATNSVEIEHWPIQRISTEDGHERAPSEVQITSFRWIHQVGEEKDTIEIRTKLKKKMKTLGISDINVDQCIVDGYVAPISLAALEVLERSIERWEKASLLRKKYHSLRGLPSNREKWYGDYFYEKETGGCRYIFPYRLLSDEKLNLLQKEVDVLEGQQEQWKELVGRAQKIGFNIEKYRPPYNIESIVYEIVQQEELQELNSKIQNLAEEYNVDLKTSRVDDNVLIFPLDKDLANRVLLKLEEIAKLQPQWKALHIGAKKYGFWLEKKWPLDWFSKKMFQDYETYVSATPKVRALMRKFPFSTIPAGRFHIEGMEEPITIDKTFKMAKYELTNQIFFTSQGFEIPTDIEEGDRFYVDDIRYYYYPNQPHSFSHRNAYYYLGILSRQMGMKPCFKNDMTYCTKEGYRLPTIDEWRYAATGKEQTYYSGGYSAGEVGWYKGNSSDDFHDVGLKISNAFDLYDMSGNACECTKDYVFDGTTVDSIYRLVGGHYRSKPEDLSILSAIESDNSSECAFRLVLPK